MCNRVQKADMWAAGIMLFELITGYHPLCEEGDDKRKLEAKLLNYTGIKYPSKMSPHAKHMISCLCQKNISARYSADIAISHPFITRKLDEELPLNLYEFKNQNAKSIRIEAKFRRAINVFLVCGVVQKLHMTVNSSQQSTSVSTKNEEANFPQIGEQEFETYKRKIKE